MRSNVKVTYNFSGEGIYTDQRFAVKDHLVSTVKYTQVKWIIMGV